MLFPLNFMFLPVHPSSNLLTYCLTVAEGILMSLCLKASDVLKATTSPHRHPVGVLWSLKYAFAC